MTTADRRARLVAALPDDVDAILVTKLVNVRYLTGFTGSHGAVLVDREGNALLATDGRYREQAAGEAPDVAIQLTRTVAPELVRSADARRLRRLAIEGHHVTLSAHASLRDAADDVDLVPVGELVEGLRIHKDDEELRSLRSACEITDSAFTSVLGELRPGRTEREIAWFLMHAMRSAGAEGAAFDSIVAFGPHSAVPHHQPTDRVLERGDLVKLDFGARVAGYHADMTRTLVCGPAAQWQRELHATVSEVQERCRAATVVGASPVELDALARQLVGDRGHALVHGLGHGVGLEIHEQPFLVPESPAGRLADHVPVTVEPGIYLPDRGGVRIEDTVLVGDAAPEVLTRSRRDLVEV